MKKVGFIVMGSSEDRSVYQDMIDDMGPDIDVTLVGVLDGFRHERVETIYAFEPGENYIATPVPWKDELVLISEKKARREVCRIAKALYAQGVQTVLVVCTGEFDRPEETPGLFILPEKILVGLLGGLELNKIGFIVPEGGQVEQKTHPYEALSPIVRVASPYGSMDKLAAAAAAFREEDVDLIVADCMSFTAEMGALIARESGKQVVLPRQLMPKVIKSLLLIK